MIGEARASGSTGDDGGVDRADDGAENGAEDGADVVAPMRAMSTSVSHPYHAFSLDWMSEGLAIPELQDAQDNGTEATASARITIREEDPQHWPELAAGSHDTPFLQMGRGDLRLTVEGLCRFRISNAEQIAWHRADRSVSDQDLRTFLLGSAVGALLIQRGMLVLHGNALERDGQAIVCLGHSGAGKSTLAYALMQQGWRLLADDLVAITPDGQVLPGIPRIKLWHDAAKAFGLNPGELAPIRQGLQKYLLMGQAIERAVRPCPLRALYLIRQQRRDRNDPDKTHIARISSQRQAALCLRNQAFRPRFVRGLGQEGANFIALARLQQQVPLATLPTPWGVAEMQAWLQEQSLLSAAADAQSAEEPTA